MFTTADQVAGHGASSPHRWMNLFPHGQYVAGRKVSESWGVKPYRRIPPIVCLFRESRFMVMTGGIPARQSSPLVTGVPVSDPFSQREPVIPTLYREDQPPLTMADQWSSNRVTQCLFGWPGGATLLRGRSAASASRGAEWNYASPEAVCQARTRPGCCGATGDACQTGVRSDVPLWATPSVLLTGRTLAWIPGPVKRNPSWSSPVLLFAHLFESPHVRVGEPRARHLP